MECLFGMPFRDAFWGMPFGGCLFATGPYPEAASPFPRLGGELRRTVVCLPILCKMGLRRWVGHPSNLDLSLLYYCVSLHGFKKALVHKAFCLDTTTPASLRSGFSFD